MKKAQVKKNLIFTALTALAAGSAMAGNPERQGQSGAMQLTVNGFARSSGWGWANAAGVSGVEAMYLNPAGLDNAKHGTELIFSRTQWLSGSGIGVNNFGFTQRIGSEGEGGSLGVSVMQFGIKPIDITTETNPYGGLGTYRVNMTNIGLGYGKSFSNNISAGIVFRAVTEGIPDAKAMGMSLDAGVQYSTTLRPAAKAVKKNDIHFGIAVKNIGPDMRHTGDGLSFKALLQDGTFDKTMQVKVDKIKLPSLLCISGSYDMKLDGSPDVYNNRLTVGFGFTNFAYSANQTTLGLEYGYKDFLCLRAGYVIQKGTFESDYTKRTSAYTGFSGGISYDWRSGGGNVFTLDYSYRATNPFNGTHSFGVRIGLGGGE
ncbi:MAG: PorV/PorQ family protein [Bacteroidetes bacterium]|nr:PorV/PorQ family protein [Bacteroidota bacterium]